MDGCERVGSQDYNINTFTISDLPYGRSKRHSEIQRTGKINPVLYSSAQIYNLHNVDSVA